MTWQSKTLPWVIKANCRELLMRIWAWTHNASAHVSGKKEMGSTKSKHEESQKKKAKLEVTKHKRSLWRLEKISNEDTTMILLEIAIRKQKSRVCKKKKALHWFLTQAVALKAWKISNKELNPLSSLINFTLDCIVDLWETKQKGEKQGLPKRRKRYSDIY